MRSGNSLVAGTLMLIGLPLLSGCAGVQVQSQFDEHAPFGAYRTFGWDTRLDEDPTTVDADLRAAARAGVEAVLRRKGFEGPTDRNPDFRVHYTLGVEVAKLRVQVDDGDLTQPDIITPGRSGVGDVPDHGKQDPQVTEPFDSDWQVEGFESESLEEGDVIVEIIDTRTSQLVWFGWGKGLADPTSPDNDYEKIAEAVLAKFPPPLSAKP
ncbi:MAG: DUF4136 domain-containing protein [Gemmatimonadetes bacterium]|nr:DUF4136 domain-containing protein [Gemmatimonadota bacterium]